MFVTVVLIVMKGVFLLLIPSHRRGRHVAWLGTFAETTLDTSLQIGGNRSFGEILMDTEESCRSKVR